MPAVEVSSLTVGYPGRPAAVDDVSFQADFGEVVALLGPNGAGKTSTIEALEGYRSPSSGRVTVLGLDPRRDSTALAGRIGVMLQDGGVYPGIRPAEAVRLFASYYADPEDPAQVLERTGLAAVASTPWRRLSGGERRRLSLALALVGRPEVAFLDEPTAGIDVAGRQLVRAVLSGLREAGTCVLLATHELDEAERVADRVLVFDRGRVLASGTPGELAAGAGPGAITFAGPHGLDVEGLGAAIGTAVTETEPGRYRVPGTTSVATVAAVAAWLAERDVAVSGLQAGGATLEDAFLRLTAGGGDGGR